MPVSPPKGPTLRSTLIVVVSSHSLSLTPSTSSAVNISGALSPGHIASLVATRGRLQKQ